MLDFNYKSDKLVGRCCLEMSLKPFKSFDDESIRSVCAKIFYDWQKLIDKSDSLAVMLWTADGSEILEYSGDLSQSFEYCDVIGIGNPRKTSDYTESEKNYLHARPVPYNGERKKMDYDTLRRIIKALKEVGLEICKKPVSVIETFDPGPEFAKSDFKYNRHKEICKGNIMGERMWLHCASELHAEQRRYAAYPDGIPEGTHFGEFLGRQLMHLVKDIGFDGIWLSNGFGFSLASWNWKGEVFDGNRFDTENLGSVRDSINRFWKSFTAEIGDMLVETRGSNLSTAMDISAHGCPIDDIYKYNMLTPPNSPWAALNYRFGLELAGYMSHIAQISEKGYLFRYYTHDPWWYNSPWFDRYGRSPHDIYLPLALARIDENGEVTKPYGVNLLSIDDSFGNMPEKCANEVIPHILEGFNNYSDRAGLVCWLYPFATYCETGLYKSRPETLMMDDWLMESAIDCGFPLNTVVSDKSFMTAPTDTFSDSIIVTPVPPKGSVAEACVFRAVEAGLRVMLFGSTHDASEKMRAIIGVELDTPIEGKLLLRQDVVCDSFTDASLSDTINHNPLLSNGGVRETSRLAYAYVTDQNGNERAYCTVNREKNIVWIRGSFPHNGNTNDALPLLEDASVYFPPAYLFRASLDFFGIHISYNGMYTSDKLPINLYSRHDNAYYFTGFAKDTTITTDIRFPYGVPLPTGTSTIVEDNMGRFINEQWSHKECRVFVKQSQRSKLSCIRKTAGDTMMADYRIEISGLVNADVTFLPPPNSVVYSTPKEYNFTADLKAPDEIRSDGSCVFNKVSGKLYIIWQDKQTEEHYRKIGHII